MATKSTEDIKVKTFVPLVPFVVIKMPGTRRTDVEKRMATKSTEGTKGKTFVTLVPFVAIIIPGACRMGMGKRMATKSTEGTKLTKLCVICASCG
jgi:hypothetical protein